jgi:hypothetical protein
MTEYVPVPSYIIINFVVIGIICLSVAGYCLFKCLRLNELNKQLREVLWNRNAEQPFEEEKPKDDPVEPQIKPEIPDIFLTRDGQHSSHVKPGCINLNVDAWTASVVNDDYSITFIKVHKLGHETKFKQELEIHFKNGNYQRFTINMDDNERSTAFDQFMSNLELQEGGKDFIYLEIERGGLMFNRSDILLAKVTTL